MTKHSNVEHDVDIYRRVLKYSPFALKRRPGLMKIIHHLAGGGEVIAECVESVTVEDAEKLFAALHIIVDTQDDHEEKSVKTTVHVKDIRRICRANDDMYIVHALERITKLSITYIYPGDKRGVLHIINSVEFNERTGEITLHLNSDFYRLCQEKALTINIARYSALSPAAKNLYAYLCSNSGEVFTEALLIERAVIQTTAPWDARKKLRRALDELKARKIIKGYTKPKKGLWKIIKIEEEDYPQQS